MKKVFNPLVTIIVASYNYDRYIAETLNSLINQTYKNLEILVIDDGSTDNSINIIRDYAKKDERIKLITHPNNENKGLAKSIQTAIQNAKGEYISFCESDDFLKLNHIEEKVKYIKKFPNADIVVNKPLMFGDDEKIKKLQNGFASLFYQLEKLKGPKRYFYEMEYTWTFPTFSTVMAKREHLLLCDFNPNPSSAIDIWLWKQLTSKYKTGFINKFLTYWRIHTDSLSNTGAPVKDDYWDNLNKILNTNKDFLKYKKRKKKLNKIIKPFYSQEIKGNILRTRIIGIPFKKKFSNMTYIWKENNGKHYIVNLFGIKIKIKNRNIDRQKRTIPMDYIRYFEIHLTDHCNLNCYSCNHFSPLAEKSFLDLKEFISDFKKMSELTAGHVDIISLMGGEPLLHPQINKFINTARYYFPNSNIQIVTNGLLLHNMDDNFWEHCKKNNIWLSCTEYPLNIKWDIIRTKAKQYGVNVFFLSEDGMHELQTYKPCTKDNKNSWYYPLDLDGKQNIIKNFQNCKEANSCIHLRHGKLYTCCVAPNICHFNTYFNKNIPLDTNDGINIYKAKNLREILDFLSKPIQFCKYCNVKKRKLNLPWKKSDKSIKEYT